MAKTILVSSEGKYGIEAGVEALRRGAVHGATMNLKEGVRDADVVIGDLAVSKRADGTQLPGVAQVAMQGGAQAGRNIARLLRHGPTEPSERTS